VAGSLLDEPFPGYRFRRHRALASPAVSGYSTADLRLAWRPRAGVELALLARNLGDGGHGEFTSIATRTEIGRGVYATVRWDFGTP
jgi:iron complex outermembrane receptor protein